MEPLPIALLNPRSAKARFTGADCSLKRIAKGEMVLVQGAGTLSTAQRCRHEITRSLGPVQIQIGTISGDQQGPMSTRWFWAPKQLFRHTAIRLALGIIRQCNENDQNGKKGAQVSY